MKESEKNKKQTPKQFEDPEINRKMSNIKHIILVLSGKGGVGKSTVAANIAKKLSANGKKTALLDVDIHGPSIPKMFGLSNVELPPTKNPEIIKPFEVSENLKMMSIGFFLKNEDDALIWRGPMKIGVIKQFLKDVDWGEQDYLIIDFPPGTGDEPLSIAQFIPDTDGAVLVTTPQEISWSDVRKSINFCRKLSLPILGVVENMSGFICPECGEKTEIFPNTDSKNICRKLSVPFLGRIPLNPEIAESSENIEKINNYDFIDPVVDQLVTL